MLLLTFEGGQMRLAEPELVERLLRNQQQVDAAAKAEALLLATVYRVDGEPDEAVPFGGLLTRRLQLSESSIRALIASGQLGYFCGAKKAYRVTEPDVRAYIASTQKAAA